MKINKLAALVTCMILVCVFGAFSPNSTLIDDGYEWCGYAMYIALVYPAGLGLVMIFYAVKNTIKGK